MSTEKKSFDPTVGFMFFGSWVKSIDLVKSSIGDKAALALFSAIAEYSMYDDEPDFSEYPILNAVWATIEREIDLSIGNRKRGFSRDGLNENYRAILHAVISNPGASLREIGEMTGTDKNMVDRVKRKFRAEIEAAIYAKANNPVADGVDGSAAVFDSACNCNNAIASDGDSDADTDSDSTRRDNAGQMGQAQESDPYWTDSTNGVNGRFTAYDRIREIDIDADEYTDDDMPF